MMPGPLLLDNTVLTNFALVGRVDLVLGLSAEVATTPAVMAEYVVGVAGHGLPANVWDPLSQLTLQPDEQRFADHLPPRLGRGERSCIAVAVHRRGLFASDDMKARLEAQRHGVTVTGTVGILVLNVKLGRLVLKEGNTLLTGMIAQGYRSSVLALDELL